MIKLKTLFHEMDRKKLSLISQPCQFRVLTALRNTSTFSDIHIFLFLVPMGPFFTISLPFLFLYPIAFFLLIMRSFSGMFSTSIISLANSGSFLSLILYINLLVILVCLLPPLKNSNSVSSSFISTFGYFPLEIFVLAVSGGEFLEGLFTSQEELISTGGFTGYIGSGL